MSNDRLKSDINSLLGLIYSNKELVDLINDIQVDGYLNNSKVYNSYLKDHYLRWGEYKKSMERYASFLTRIFEVIVPDFHLIDIGSSRVVLGYKQFAIKIWYNTKIQHEDDLEFDKSYSDSEFPYKFLIYYSDEHLIITKRYETFLNVLQLPDALSQAEIDIKKCCEKLSLNDRDINIYNIGYDTETSSYVLLDYGFMLGKHKGYIMHDKEDYLLSFYGKPVSAYIKGINNHSIVFGNCPVEDYELILSQDIDPMLTKAILCNIFYSNYEEFADRTDINNLAVLIEENLQNTIYFASFKWDILPDFSAINICKYTSGKVEVLMEYYIYSNNMDEELVDRLNIVFYRLRDSINDSIALEASNVSLSFLLDLYPEHFIQDTTMSMKLEPW